MGKRKALKACLESKLWTRQEFEIELSSVHFAVSRELIKLSDHLFLIHNSDFALRFISYFVNALNISSFHLQLKSFNFMLLIGERQKPQS